MPYEDRRLYGVCCAEKGTFRFRVRARGRAGHASVPGAGGQRAAQARCPALERLGAAAPAMTWSTSRARSSGARGGPGRSGGRRGAHARRRAASRRAARADARGDVRAHDHLGEREDQRDPGAGGVRGRLPPASRPGRGRRRRRALELSAMPKGWRSTGWRTSSATARRSPRRSWTSSPRGCARRTRAARSCPRAARLHRFALVPGRLPRLRRLRLLPAAPPDLYETWPLMHSADERIDVRDLGFATEFFAELPRRLLT